MLMVRAYTEKHIYESSEACLIKQVKFDWFKFEANLKYEIWQTNSRKIFIAKLNFETLYSAN